MEDVESKNCNILYESPLVPPAPLSDRVTHMSCLLFFSLAACLPVSGVSMGRFLITAAAWPFKSEVSAPSASPLSPSLFRAVMRTRNTIKFFSSITTLPFWTDFLLKGFLKSYPAAVQPAPQLAWFNPTNRLFSSPSWHFVQQRSTCNLNITL